MLPEFKVPGIEIVSVTKPKASHEFPCVWARDGHTIPKGKKYVRVVYKNKETSKFESDHVCVDCWTSD